MNESNIPNLIKHLRTMALRASLTHDVTVALNEASDCVEYLLSKLPSHADKQKQAIRGYLDQSVDTGELPSFQLDEVVRACEKALLNPNDYTGVSYEIESGRDCRDHRCYTLHWVEATDCEHPDIKLADLIEAINQ